MIKAKLKPSEWNQKYQPGVDKQEHAIAGVIIGLGSFFLVEELAKSWLKLNKTGAIALAFIFSISAVCIILYGKEVWDSLGHGYADLWDCLCGIIAFVCIGIPLIIFYAYRQLK